ncbi:hypothetical protein L208DRAFT_1522515, partial [Tricholoma matsutake]
QLLSARRRTLTEHGGYSIETCFHGFEKLSKADLLSLAAAHGMSPVGSLDHIKSMITDHILKGQCMTLVHAIPFACSDVRTDCFVESSAEFLNDEFQIYLLSKVANTSSARVLRRVLDSYNIPYDSPSRLSHLRKQIHLYIHRLRKGKHAVHNTGTSPSQRSKIASLWPPSVASSQLKQKIIQMFQRETSSEKLRESTCAACTESCSVFDCEWVKLSDIDVMPLQQPDQTSQHLSAENEDDMESDRYPWFHPHTIPPIMPFVSGPLADIVVDAEGVRVYASQLGCEFESTYEINLCLSCRTCLESPP